MMSTWTRRQFGRITGAGLAAPFLWRAERAWAQGGSVTLKLGHPDTTLHPNQAIAQKLSEMVSEKTHGAVKIQVFAGGQLGSETNLISGMQTGIVDMAMHTTGFLESFYPKVQVLDLPFIFKDTASAEKLLDGPIGQGLLADMPSKGIYGFVWGHYAWRVTETATQPVHEPADLKGLKIRIQPGAAFAASFKALGAVPVVMDISEVYLGISQKTIAGLEVPIIAVVSSKFYEVIKDIALTNHVYNAGALMASKRKFDSLDPAFQKAIRDSATEIQPIWRKAVADKSTSDAEFLKSKGVTITDIDYPAFRKAMEPVYAEFRDKIGADLVAQVLKAGQG